MSFREFLWRAILNLGKLTVTKSTISDNKFDCNSCISLGGGIYSKGTLNVTNRAFSNNSSICNLLNCATVGGGNYNDGLTSNIANSSFMSNTAHCIGANCYAWGGGIMEDADTTLTLSNSTVISNSVLCFGSSCSAWGGGRWGSFSLWSNVINSTFSGNGANCAGTSCTSGGGGVTSLNPINMIVANSPIGGDCVSVTADNFNLANDVTCDTATQKTSAQIKLGALANYGGPTQSMALLPGSVAINAGNDAVCNAAPVSGTDQRGVARPQGAHCDVGAYEVMSRTLNFLPLIMR